uniref:AlNc14C1220G12838 protein n=1 Tax=Albugo laibachii Nc14 TaxID=890382 RepID=F0X2K7_9STRA|nr:AlNc14C1220G12838 [Albugo laibachii Nc14]|eukprot:CCA28119.1 AlNc14C1220G12838 [Albugo laibachii Nc14]
MGPSTVKGILVLARRWDVKARDGDILYTRVKDVKDKQVDSYLRIPKGMFITQKDIRKLGVTRKADMTLQLKKSPYGLNQAGKLWSHLLVSEIGFKVAKLVKVMMDNQASIRQLESEDRCLARNT